MSRSRHRAAPADGASTPATRSTSTTQVAIRQYGVVEILAVWAAAALPMAVLSWLVAPALADRLSGAGGVPLMKALLACLTAGLVWQFVLVVVLVRREQRTPRWWVVREALWLRSPRSPRTGRSGGRTWLVVIPLVVLFAAAGLVPGPSGPPSRDLGAFLDSATGRDFLAGNWTWFSVLVVLWVFNTVLGEELLFRGLLLPRMNGVFGRLDWLANGVLFAAYHLHLWWSIPVQLVDAFLLSYPTKRYRSAWIGIAVHSSQSLFFGALVLALVLR
jgi:membrane protease YdiL (CAAX protease family)